MPDSTPWQVQPRAPVRRRTHIVTVVVSVAALFVVLLILLWNWDWFIPFVDARASAVLGRRVAIGHLHVRLGRTTIVTADDVTIANPDNFPQQDPLARLPGLTVAVNVMDYFRSSAIVLPYIIIDRPRIAATVLADGRRNLTILRPNAHNEQPPPQIGDLRIEDGSAHFVDPRQKSDFVLAIATREASGTAPAEITVQAHGTYAGQSISGDCVGGALLTLRDATHPYPIDLRLADGQTRVSLVGTVQDPLKFAGARLKLKLSGPDMSALFPLTGIPIPPTPPFSIAGNLAYARPKIRFTNFVGTVGSSDLNGDIVEDPGLAGKPDATMDLFSRRVDLADLGGFVGTPPGKKSTPGQTPAQRQALARAEAKETLLPNTPINLPKLRAANVHLKCRGDHIENRATPFDNITAAVDVVDGDIQVHPLSLAVGNGHVVGNIDLAPGPRDIVKARADVRFQHIALSRIMQATHTFRGEGVIGGEARIDADGNSLASMMGQGNGEAKLILLGGGDLSALLVDLTGLEFGNALLSALGVPQRTDIRCFVTDLPLNNGSASTKVLLLDTGEARITGRGTIDFRDQTLDYSLTTRSQHFSVGSLPGPIDIMGPLGSPSIRPGTEVVARAGAATGLGILLTPLGALLPTIQFGVGDDNACTRATQEEQQPLREPLLRHRAHR